MNARSWLPAVLTVVGLVVIVAIGAPVMGLDKKTTGPVPPRLQVISVTGTDQCSVNPANQNGVWQPGETIELFIELRGLGTPFTNIQGVLSSENPHVSFINDTATWPDLMTGSQTESNVEPLLVLLSEGIPCLDDIGLVLSMTADEATFEPVAIPRAAGSPFLVDLPVAIPDITDGTEILMEVIDDVAITDIDVRLVVETTWVGDLGFTLRSPAGTEVVLLDRPGHPASAFGCSNDDMDITFDDDSTFDPEDYCPGTTPWYVGEARPVEALAHVNGESTLGTWTLIVTDQGGGDLAEVHVWELLISPELEGSCEVCGDDDQVPAVGPGGLVVMSLLLVFLGGAGVRLK